MKLQKTIEVVSTSHLWLSSMSTSSRLAIRDVLRDNYQNVRITMLDNVADLRGLCRRKPDLVYLGMKYLDIKHPLLRRTDKLWIADYLDEHDIAHTGSPSIAHKRELSKPLAKQNVLQVGLATATAMVIKQRQNYTENDISLQYPVFIKPANLGGGEGIDGNSVVYDYCQLVDKVASVHALNDDALIEAYLPGREFSVAILRNIRSDDYDAMPIELIAQADENGVRMLSQAVKASNQEQVHSLPVGRLRSAVNKLALGAFSALGGQDYGRIDIRLDAHGIPHFLEANLIPSLIQDYGSFPKACMLNQSIDYKAMIITIAELAMAKTAELTMHDEAVDHLNLAQANQAVV